MKRSIRNSSFFFFFVFFCLIMKTNASTKYVTFLDALNIREGAGTNYKVIKTANVGSTYYLKSENLIPDSENGACPAGWYEIDYEGKSGYICSTYVRVSASNSTGTPSNACETEMQAAGFPSSYWQGLCSLKEKHPTWTFKAIQTNLDWTTVVSKESACGKSKIATSNSAYLDPTCHVDEGPFKGASQKAVAFYMDPRNFFTERYIFQFEYLKYEPALENSYTNAIIKMISNDAFYKYHTAKGTEFASLTTAAGKEMNINPISLAARMHQEMGSGESLYNLYSGVYSENNNEYYGYYNFYNIGVNSSCVNSITSCGLGYAKRYGWNTPYNAIKGGASLLSTSYLEKGQFTPYLQKFNVAPTESKNLYLNQYMTNIAAPSSESSTSYSTYEKMGLLESGFAFYIPVYMNMDANIDNSANGAVDPGNSSSSSSNSSIISIINTAGYSASGNYIRKINPGLTANILKADLESIAGDGNVTVTNAKGEVLNSEMIGSGSKVTIKNSAGSETYTVLIIGDTSGDGKINALDLLQVQKSILGTENLNDVQIKAADTSGDGKINALDLLQVQKSILGTYAITQ